MAETEHTRTQRVQIRIAPAAKRLIERAAALQNTSVSGFVVNSALDAASHLIREHERLVLDALRRLLHASDALAVYAVVVNAKDERAQAFYEHFGFIALPGATRRLFLPVRTLERLFDR